MEAEGGFRRFLLVLSKSVRIWTLWSEKNRQGEIILAAFEINLGPSPNPKTLTLTLTLTLTTGSGMVQRLAMNGGFLQSTNGGCGQPHSRTGTAPTRCSSMSRRSPTCPGRTARTRHTWRGVVGWGVRGVGVGAEREGGECLAPRHGSPRAAS